MLKKIYARMLKEYGKQGWWPMSKKNLETKHQQGKPCSDEDRFEIIVGAILTQNTSWKNVEKAIHNLNKAGLLDAKKMAVVQKGELAQCIRPSGYYNQKAERLRIIAKYFLQHKDVFRKPLKELREELLKVKGIGPETADSIILYAFEKPSFVIDAYTRRIFSRLGLCDEKAKYEELQAMFESRLPPNTEMFKEYHALIVEHAKRHCRKKPKCDNCILKKHCNQ